MSKTLRTTCLLIDDPQLGASPNGLSGWGSGNELQACYTEFVVLTEWFAPRPTSARSGRPERFSPRTSESRSLRTRLLIYVDMESPPTPVSQRQPSSGQSANRLLVDLFNRRERKWHIWCRGRTPRWSAADISKTPPHTRTPETLLKVAKWLPAKRRWMKPSPLFPPQWHRV